LDEKNHITPKRCPSCRSTLIIKNLPVVEENNFNISSIEIYKLFDNILKMKDHEQNKIRKYLKESAGIHILCLDESQGNLNEVLTPNEIKGYLSLIKNQNFGLAVIGASVVAVSPDSPIRHHVGVNRFKLDELENIS
jgi:hypothetical protein